MICISNIRLSYLLFFAFLFAVSSVWANNSLTDSSSVSINDTVSEKMISVNTYSIEENISSYLSKLSSDQAFPYVLVVLLLLIVIWVAFGSVYNSIKDLRSALFVNSRINIDDTKETSKATKGVAKYSFITLLIGYLFYVGIKGTTTQGFAMEWLNLIVRWAHVIAGIMWIGASFYFVFLENKLNRTKGVRDELAGNLWAIHGGGFYFLEKYKVAPKKIPEDLHWFKYEAYFTWLTGFSLLFIVYYMDAKAFLIDPSIADLSAPLAIGIGVGTLIIGYVLYDFLCRSPLINNQRWFAIVGFIILTVIAYFLTHVFNPRAAYIHFGALIGTIMAGNVYFTIIPSQKELVNASLNGRPIDPTLGKKAQQRSLHNNYFTLPVVFIMISNHFPSTFGHEYNWVVLMGISLTSAGIKHYWNLLERGIVRKKILFISVVALLSIGLVTSPLFEENEASIPVAFEEVNEIIQARCTQCHSSFPTDDQWTSAPNGVMYDTPEQIKSMADKIMTRTIRSKSMPLGNKTNMTDEERKKLKHWIIQGALIDK